ncbi:MAG: hypothetical protein IKS46_07810 [Clostridia bacterium]|nr:hypothetical protein [Clostridia bacterium]
MYDMQPPQPIQMPPQREKKRMSVPQIMLIVLVLAFAVWYLITALTPESAGYATITAGVIGSRYTGDCLIVRDEIPYEFDTVTRVEYIAEEGSVAEPGTKVCNIYTSGFSKNELKTLQSYRDEIRDYQIKQLKLQVKADPKLEGLESEVLTCAREVRDMIAGARGNLYNQEEKLAEAIQGRQKHLRENLYKNDQTMKRLYDEEQNQQQRISSWTKPYTANEFGIVSFYSDGYEYGLKMSNYDEFNPSQVRAMLNGQKPQSEISLLGKTTVYRLVKDGHWVVLMLIRDSNWNPMEGASYELKLENFKDTVVRAKVLSFTRTGGELEVRLDVEASVQPVLYIRTCSGVLGDSVSSLTVPANALFTQDNMPGVVVMKDVYGPTFIPVNVMDKRDGMLFISPIQAGSLFEGETVMLF